MSPHMVGDKLSGGDIFITMEISKLERSIEDVVGKKFPEILGVSASGIAAGDVKYLYFVVGITVKKETPTSTVNKIKRETESIATQMLPLGTQVDVHMKVLGFSDDNFKKLMDRIVLRNFPEITEVVYKRSGFGNRLNVLITVNDYSRVEDIIDEVENLFSTVNLDREADVRVGINRMSI